MTWNFRAKDLEIRKKPGEDPKPGEEAIDGEDCSFQPFLSRRRVRPARPINPVPRSPRVPGSGVAVMFVSPLAICVDPLKYPVPVLIVNWIVAPLADWPLNQVPMTEPLRR